MAFQYGSDEWGKFEWSGPQPITLAATLATTTSSVQPATLDPVSASISASTATETSTVQTATITGSGTASLSASATSETSSVQTATLAPQSATLAASAGVETSVVQTATITGAGTASLSASTATETSTVQPATALPQTATLDATTATETSTVLSALALPQTATLAASVGTETSTVQPATIGYGQWVIDGTAITPTAITATPTTLELTIPTRTTEVRTLLDTLDANAGEVSQRELADGTIDAKDRAAGNNTYTLYADIYSNPPRKERTVHVDDIAREKSGPSGQTTVADITLVPTETRTIDADTDTDDTTKWRFDFSPGGRITTNRLSANVNSDRNTISATLVLEPLQVQTLETTTAAVAGAVSQNVPDGESLDRDTTPNSRQTVTITPPDGASDPPIESGDYLVLGWTTVGQGEGGYKVEIELTSL